MRHILSFLLFSLALGTFVNERVVRVIDLSGQVEKQIVKAEISNAGSDSLSTYYFPIPDEKRSNLAYFKATSQDGHSLNPTIVDTFPVKKGTANFEQLQEASKNFFFLQLTFENEIDSEELTQITVTLVYAHVLRMLPAEITQKENQYVVYKGNRYADSCYVTKKQHTKINVASETIKSYTKDGHENVSGKKMKYGTYSNIAPFGYGKLRAHFRNNNPFLTMTEVVRDFEISHWGNVRVSESYNIRHDGAKLVGPYETTDYANMMYGGRLAEPTAVRDLKAILPAGSSRVTYTDRIGNVSTSDFRRGRRKSILELQLRYKLLGGWKTDFVIAYDVPASEFITINKEDPKIHYFNASFGIPFNKPVADRVLTKVALPEGAYDIKLSLPFDVDEQVNEIRYTYLDSLIGGGRPVVTFLKTQIVREHFDHFQITYRYSYFRLWAKPVLLIFTFFMFFMFAIILGRTDLNLGQSTSGIVYKAAVQAVFELNVDLDENDIYNASKDLLQAVTSVHDLGFELKNDARELLGELEGKMTANNFRKESSLRKLMSFVKRLPGEKAKME